MRKKCITYSSIVDTPRSLGNFLLFLGQDQLGEKYLIYSHIQVSQNTLGKTYALHIRDIQTPLNTPPAADLTKLIPSTYFLVIDSRRI